MTPSQFSTVNNGILPTKYVDNAVELFAEVSDTTIHFDLINIKEANGSTFNHTIFGDMGSKNENLFHFINRKAPNVIV